MSKIEKKLEQYNGNVVVIEINDEINNINGKFIGLLYKLDVDKNKIYFLASPCDYNTHITDNGALSFIEKDCTGYIELATKEEVEMWGKKHREYFGNLHELNEDETTVRQNYLNDLLFKKLLKEAPKKNNSKKK